MMTYNRSPNGFDEKLCGKLENVMLNFGTLMDCKIDGHTTYHQIRWWLIKIFLLIKKSTCLVQVDIYKRIVKFVYVEMNLVQLVSAQSIN